MKIVPNPNNGEFNLLYNINSASLNVKIKVYDVAGKLVFEQALDKESNLTAIKPQNLNNGIYHFTLVDDKGDLIYTNKLVIIK